MVFYRKTIELIVTLCENTEVIFLSLMTAMVFILVVSRYVFSYSFAWIEELTRYLMIWAAYLGAAALFKDDEHIRMDLLYCKLPGLPRAILDLIFGLAQITFLAFLTILGFQYSSSVRLFVIETLGNLSMYWVTLIIPISSALMVVIISFNFIRTLSQLIKKETSLEPKQSE